ncbi:MAG: PAS domain-containing protein [Acidobacteria bacterium]|nr:PAS domain-containing protein [Acidobacteriota bacterium]
MHKVRPYSPVETGRIDRPAPADIDFESVFSVIPTPLMIMDRDFVIRFANAAYLTTTFCALSEIQGRYVFEAFPETEERTRVFLSAFELALAGTPNVLTTEPFAIPVDGGGTRELIWTCTHLPVRGADGEIAFIMQNAVDVTAKFAREQENKVLMRELDHRVKNSLATVQAVTRMSLVEAKSVQSAKEDLLGRFRAMSEAQNLLIDRNAQGSTVGDVLANALIPFGYEQDKDGRIQLAGPLVRITAKQTQALAMALHELATNAAKYGALSDDRGTVHVTWTFDKSHGSHFDLVWREAGGPEVSQPTRQGFGTTMLTRILAQEINGEISLEYNLDGLICRMEGWLEDRN